jgi:peptide deformylase
MFETMYAAEGIGLAAPQIGVSERIAVVDVPESCATYENEEQGLRAQSSNRIELINPEILEASGSRSGEEGCLSIPGYREKVKRATGIRVRAQDRYGETFEFSASDLLAICIQHEIDHLDGVLFIDHLSRLKRELFKHWFKKHGS